MTTLADGDSRGGRRRGGGASRPRRPCLCEIRRGDPEFLRRQAFCHPQHDLVVSSSTLEVSQLFQEVIFLLTPITGMLAYLRLPFTSWQALQTLNLALNSRSVVGSTD